MKIKSLICGMTCLSVFLAPDVADGARGFVPEPKTDVPVDSIILSDPAVIADPAPRLLGSEPLGRPSPPPPPALTSCRPTSRRQYGLIYIGV